MKRICVRSFSIILEMQDISTEIAHSAEEAIKRQIESFDLILLDVMMGAMSGFRFADKLTE